MYGGTTLDRYLLDKLSGKTMGSTSYLSKPRLGCRSAYNTSDKENSYTKNKKSKSRKSAPKMSEYGIKKRLPDYTELAYKEAVSRLRYFLSESYAPSSRSSKVGAHSIKNLDESGDEGYDVLPKSKYSQNLYGGLRQTYNPVFLPQSKPSILAKRYPFYPRENFRSYGNTENTGINGGGDGINLSNQSVPLVDQTQAGKLGSGDPELMGFIQKQEEYIEQLERESSYCREELNNLLGKVKEVISENETLHEKQKNHLISSVMDQRSVGSDSEEEEGDGDSDHKYSTAKSKKAQSKPSKRMEGPNIVFESKISELEAQLTQANIDLKKMQDENNEYRRKLSEGMVDSPCMDTFKRQIENLQRDKSSLETQVARLRSSLDDCKDTDSDLVSKAKRSADMVFQANHDKVQLEMEIRRLKEELERQQSRVRELLSEQARRVMEERSAVERRYCSQVEQLTSDLTTHWDSATKLQLELERQKREESDLKRELAQKNSQIEDLKMELKNKVASLQADMAQAHADKSAVEEELASARLLLERHQRQAKHDSNRLNSEIQSVRQRLDRADADLVHSRRENLRLIDQLANLEKEMNLKSLRPASPSSNKDKEGIKDKDLSSMIHNMETKHAQTVSELEAMVCSQNSLMEKLTAECHLLTSKLDDASQRHKEEMASLQNKLEQLSARVSQASLNTNSNLNNQAPTPHSASRTTDNYITEKPNSHQNSRVIDGKNGDKHTVERNDTNGTSVPPGNSFTEPDQRKTSRQPSRSNIVEATNPNGIPDKRGDETKEHERFEKNFKESEVDRAKIDLNPPNSPLNSKKNVDVSEHSLDDNNKHISDNLKDGEIFGDLQYEDGKHDTEYADEGITNLEKTDYDANQVYDPNQQYTEQNQEYTDPNQEYTDPNQQYVDPGQEYVDPNQQYIDQNQEYAEQTQEYVEPNQQYVNPNREYSDPNQEYADPNQVIGDPDQHFNDPNQEYTDPNQEYTDPNQQYTDPNQEYTTDQQNQEYNEQGYSDPNQQYAPNQDQQPVDLNNSNEPI